MGETLPLDPAGFVGLGRDLFAPGPSNLRLLIQRGLYPALYLDLADQLLHRPRDRSVLILGPFPEPIPI